MGINYDNIFIYVFNNSNVNNRSIRIDKKYGTIYI